MKKAFLFVVFFCAFPGVARADDRFDKGSWLVDLGWSGTSGSVSYFIADRISWSVGGSWNDLRDKERSAVNSGEDRYYSIHTGVTRHLRSSGVVVPYAGGSFNYAHQTSVNEYNPGTGPLIFKYRYEWVDMSGNVGARFLIGKMGAFRVGWYYTKSVWSREVSGTPEIKSDRYRQGVGLSYSLFF